MAKGGPRGNGTERHPSGEGCTLAMARSADGAGEHRKLPNEGRGGGANPRFLCPRGPFKYGLFSLHLLDSTTFSRLRRRKGAPSFAPLPPRSAVCTRILSLLCSLSLFSGARPGVLGAHSRSREWGLELPSAATEGAAVMGSSRVLPVSIPLDSPEPVLERLITEDNSQASPNGERSSLMNRELNGGLSAISSPVGGGKRDIFNRPFAGSKSLHNDDADLEDVKEERDWDKSHKAVKAHNQALLSGLAYCLSSCSMILVNKFVLSGYNFNAGISLMVYQNFISVVVVSTLSFFGVISTEPLTWKLARVWLPVNVIFVGMLMTSIFSLKYINVAMVTVLKNVTNVITAVGETYLFKKYHGGKVWAALMLMIVSAVSGGMTDLSFHAVGYTWQTLNCFLTASYSLTLRRTMDSAKQVTKSGNLNEFSMVLLNNVLSLPLGLLLIFLDDEVDYLSKTPLLNMPMFWVVITLSGLLGLAISFTSMWFLHQTGATTYSLVGSLNKIPLSVAGIVLFNVPTSLENLISILFGLLAGVFFAKAKMGERSKA